MIARLVGQVVDKNLNQLVIDVHGVGYEVVVSTTDSEHILLDQPVTLTIYHHIREQSQELFGFLDSGAKALFELLITVQGVGPKAGMAILSVGEFEQVRSAIARSDSQYVQQAHGVGKKTAERVVVDLSDKVGLPTIIGSDAFQTELDTSDEAVEALVALGYTETDAVRALQTVDPKLSTSERVRQALQR